MGTAYLKDKFADHETPSPATDGAQVIFTVASEYVSGTLKVFVDGLRQTKDVDYTETNSTSFTMTKVLDSDEALRVDYLKP